MKNLKKTLWNKLHDDFGNGADDREEYEMVLDERLNETINSMRPDKIKIKEAKMFSEIDGYFKEVENLSNKLIDKYGADTPSFFKIWRQESR